MALDLMQYTGEAQLFPQLNDAILDILKQLRKKPEQVVRVLFNVLLLNLSRF